MPAPHPATPPLRETELSPKLVVLTLGGETPLTSWGTNCVALATANGTLVVEDPNAPVKTASLQN